MCEFLLLHVVSPECLHTRMVELDGSARREPTNCVKTQLWPQEDGRLLKTFWELITVFFGLENACQWGFIKTRPAAAVPAVMRGSAQFGPSAGSDRTGEVSVGIGIEFVPVINITPLIFFCPSPEHFLRSAPFHLQTWINLLDLFLRKTPQSSLK